ncbi:MAG: hypothetical protein LBV42_04360 [Methanobrevibacter sp.]|jgi:hypothetical protein|nr:hypothetical protein [Methanobrevibacter sp.]
MSILDILKNEDDSFNIKKVIGGCCGLIIIVVILMIAFSGSHNYTTNNPKSDVNFEQELKENATEVSYSTLKGWKKDNMNKSVQISGKVMQSPSGGIMLIRSSEEIVYWSGIFNTTYYENDPVTVYGLYSGPYTYSTAIGGTNTVPSLKQCRTFD